MQTQCCGRKKKHEGEPQEIRKISQKYHTMRFNNTEYNPMTNTYSVYTLTLQRPLIFGVFQGKMAFFPKVLFLKSSTVFCMLVMFTHGGTAETVEIK